MSLEKFTNNAITTLGSAVAPTDTSITLSTGSGALFPSLAAGQYFTGTMFAAGSSAGTPNEIVKVTARVGDTLTVVRGQQGTSASSWSVGDTFTNFPTAEFLNGIVLSGDVQIQSGNSAIDTGAANQGIIVLSPAVTNLSQILLAPIRVKKMASANNSTYTLIVNGLTAKSVTINGQPMAAGQLLGSQVFEVVWDGTNFELLSSPSKIQNNQLAIMPANTIKANLTGSGSTPNDTTLAALQAALGVNTYDFASKGHYQFPDGFTIQWGPCSATGESATTVTFDIPFPTACVAAVASAFNTGESSENDFWIQVVSLGATTARLFFNSSDGDSSFHTGVYIAIGY